MWSSLTNDVFNEKKAKNRNFSFKKVSSIFDSEESILLDTVRSSHSEHLNSHSTKFSTIDILSPVLDHYKSKNGGEITKS